MVRTWNQVIKGTALNATAAYPTFADIDTITVTNRADHIWGFYVLAVNKKPTADEASSPILRWSSTQLKATNVTINCGTIGAEGMAAHPSGYVKKVFIPWSPPQSGTAIHYAKISFQISSVVANTEGWDVMIQLVTSDTPATMDLIHAYLGDYCLGFIDGNEAVEAAGAGDDAALAAWGTDDASSVVLDGSAQELVGILYTVTLNAETAGVPLCNMAELVNTNITDFSPQEHIVNAGAPGSLGTVICTHGEITLKHTPFPFDGLPAITTNIYISDINSLTGLTAGDGVLSLLWK